MTKIQNSKKALLSLIVIIVVSVCAGNVVAVRKATAQTTQPDSMQFRYDSALTGDYSAVAGSVMPNDQLNSCNFIP